MYADQNYNKTHDMNVRQLTLATSFPSKLHFHFAFSFRYIRQMQIKLNKPLAELNNLIMRNNLQPTPKRSSLINQYPKQHKENQCNVSNISRSPARSMSRKALASKEDSAHSINQNDTRGRAKSRRTDREAPRTCQNHESIDGAFHINIDGEDLYYCEKCATKLKSQGFPIKRAFEGAQDDSRRREAQRTLLPSFSHLEGHPQFEVLKALLSEIYDSETRILRTQGNRVEQLLERAFIEQDSFFDSLQDLIRVRREQCRAQLQSLSQSFTQKWRDDAVSQAADEISLMKRDIEQNVESIIGQVEEETFAQCVDNYKERLDALNRIAEQRAFDTEKLKQKLESQLSEEANRVQTEVLRIQAQTVSCSSQRVLTSEINEVEEDGQPRGPFRNLFKQEKDKPKKRLISRK